MSLSDGLGISPTAEARRPTEDKMLAKHQGSARTLTRLLDCKWYVVSVLR